MSKLGKILCDFAQTLPHKAPKKVPTAAITNIASAAKAIPPDKVMDAMTAKANMAKAMIGNALQEAINKQQSKGMLNVITLDLSDSVDDMMENITK